MLLLRHFRLHMKPGTRIISHTCWRHKWMTTAKRSDHKAVVVKRSSAKKVSAKETTSKKAAAKPRSMPREGKDPKGELTAAGRRYFAEKEGSHLRPGVTGPADTPEKMLRKGSFLRRHYANPRGPVVDGRGEPTRQALQAAAWGEPVPKSEADEKKLARKGSELLEKYHEAKGDKAKGRAAGSKMARAKKAAGNSGGRKSAR